MKQIGTVFLYKLLSGLGTEDTVIKNGKYHKYYVRINDY